ncbi:MAG: NAD(P)(+) transhydrogenase (Re/Si-specific) subunit beta [Crocinitomicaceae bacterium]
MEAGVLQICYFIAMVSFIIGLKYLSNPQKSKYGNIIAGVGMGIAIISTLISVFLGSGLNINMILILIAITLGMLIGRRMSDRAAMTDMPQLVSYFNAMGGGCAMLLGVLEAQNVTGEVYMRSSEVLLLIAMMIGSMSFSGSIIAYLKLSGKLGDKKSRFVMIFSRLALLSIVLIVVLSSFNILGLTLTQEMIILLVLALTYGIVFVFPIGGADMPVVISLLNSFTGIATALAGIMFSNIIMISGGIFVGASGVLLTLLMCKAMNRSLWKVLAGKFKGNGIQSADGVEMDIKPTTVGEVCTKLLCANKVAIIPGYGLAVAQAQHLCNQLEKVLAEKDIEVDYIIHPVAGRMPGHMNVLLAEADVHYDKLKEMEEVNDEMGTYDVAIVVGANDVVNPAAENDENSAIYGMPIIKAYNCGSVIVIKRGMSKGYAGIENLLFGEPNCQLLFADAKAALNDIVNELKTI